MAVHLTSVILFGHMGTFGCSFLFLCQTKFRLQQQSHILSQDDKQYEEATLS